MVQVDARALREQPAARPQGGKSLWHEAVSTSSASHAGQEAIRLHPDLERGLEFEYAASDVMADVLHAVADYYRRNADGDPSQLVHEVWKRSLTTYDGARRTNEHLDDDNAQQKALAEGEITLRRGRLLRPPVGGAARGRLGAEVS